jgi:hypothetical protein
MSVPSSVTALIGIPPSVASSSNVWSTISREPTPLGVSMNATPHPPPLLQFKSPPFVVVPYNLPVESIANPAHVNDPSP